MKEVVDWAVQNLGPNVLKYTTDQATPQQLFESGAIDAVGFWNSLARLEYLGGHKEAALLVPPTIYPANGYLWVPKSAAAPGARPDLHELAAGEGRPVPERLADRPRPVERAVRGLPGSRLRRPGARLVQGRLLHLLPDARPDQVGVQDDRLAGLQRQLEGLPGLLRPSSSASRPADAQDVARPPHNGGRADRSAGTEADRGQ